MGSTLFHTGKWTMTKALLVPKRSEWTMQNDLQLTKHWQGREEANQFVVCCFGLWFCWLFLSEVWLRASLASCDSGFARVWLPESGVPCESSLPPPINAFMAVLAQPQCRIRERIINPLDPYVRCGRGIVDLRQVIVTRSRPSRRIR